MPRGKRSKNRELEAVLLEYAERRKGEVVSSEAASYIVDNDILSGGFYRDAKYQKVVRLVRRLMEKGLKDPDGNTIHFSNFVVEAEDGKGGWVQQGVNSLPAVADPEPRVSTPRGDGVLMQSLPWRAAVALDDRPTLVAFFDPADVIPIAAEHRGRDLATLLPPDRKRLGRPKRQSAVDDPTGLFGPRA
jgi:hypothetical protein